MGLGSVEGPPKKKMKQAQLNFCVSTEKTNNKRKLSDHSDGLASKLFRKDSSKTQAFNKENVVVVDDVDKPDDVVPKKDERENVVARIEDDPEDVADNHILKPPVDSADDGKQEATSQQDGSNEESKAAAEPVDTESVEMGTETPQETVKASPAVDKTNDDKGSSQAAETSISDPVDAEKSSKDDAESKHDESAESGDVAVVLSSDGEQNTSVNSPDQKSTPRQKRLLTPRSSSKKAERERLREERLRLKKEKEEQKRKEKEEKEKKKQEELRLKEEEKKKKEEERKRKEEAKEEEKRRKEEERKRKEEAKEEERRKKEDEKKKKEELKEEDRRKKEEAERKENLAKAAFTKFFIQEKNKSLLKKDETEVQTEKTEKSKFMPFPVKSDMRLAVQVRHTLTDEEKKALTEALGSENPRANLYINELKNGRKPKTTAATWPLSEEQHDVIIVESVEEDESDALPEAKSKCAGQKAKLLQFHENRRPPYWGTWRKPSKTVGPRRPFGQDKLLDYEVDSDSEWEDEEEGEDIDKEDGDSDKEEADDENVGENGYVLDNTFVPHGYLSDEEAAEAEDDESVEDQKLKLTVLKKEFDQELKSKTQRLQPRLLGCVYISNKIIEVSKSLYEPLMKLRCKWDPNEEPIDVLSPSVVECNPSPSVSNNKFPSSMVGQLAKLIHGNRSSLKALISEFLDSCEKDNQLSAISKRAVFLKVKEIAAKTYSPKSGRLVWSVNPAICAEFGLEPIESTAPAQPSPMAEPPKPKESPLVNFLKKTPTPQGSVKRISNTLVSRDVSSETVASRGLCGVVHIDTPRPKTVPPVAMNASLPVPDKPKRRVVPTLVSSVVGPVLNKAYNVVEIYKPGSSSMATMLPKVTASECVSVDLTDSNDGVSKLPDEAKETCNVTKPMDALEDGSKPPLPEIKDSLMSSSTEPSAVTAKPDASEPPLAETEDSPMQTTPVKPAAEINTANSAKSSPNECKTSPTSTSSVEPMDVAYPLAEADTNTPKPMKTDSPKDPTRVPPSTPTARKRVPFVTLSKHVSKRKNVKSPGQKTTITDMFCRKPAQKDSGKPNPAAATSFIDLSSDE